MTYKTYRYLGRTEGSLNLPEGHIFIDRGSLFTARSRAEEQDIESGSFRGLFVEFPTGRGPVDPGPVSTDDLMAQRPVGPPDEGTPPVLEGSSDSRWAPDPVHQAHAARKKARGQEG